MSAVGLPDSFFTADPHWRWLIVLYFFVGGLAGGSYFLAALIDLFGRPWERPLARLGYYVALPGVILSAILLIVDLRRPERFWHMLVQSETFQPMLKAWSPMSIGSWALLVFGAFALGSFLAALAEPRPWGWRWLSLFRPPGVVGTLFVIVGALLGLYVAGYTGVLLAVTSRPLWADTTLLGLAFIVSAASTSAALLILLGEPRRLALSGIAALKRLDAWVLVLELLVLVGLVVSLGAVARAWLDAWGLLFVLGVVVLGILIPLALHWRPRVIGGIGTLASAALVLIGGFILRVVVVLSNQDLGVH
jgi:formate-dependent nitrite reductase membrane component NrfD